MSNYEFWDELGKIFNAVVAYQEKNIEFNKRFISPWIRLGNVFERQDRNKEAISAYLKAIEIDPANAQNWYELGTIHFKMENLPEAIEAFRKAIELDPRFGWAYSNLALTHVAKGEPEEAIALYLKSLDLLTEAKDKAVTWNRLGNAYRKLNRYEAALDAFHKADELDRENSGFRDNLDEVAEGPTLVQSNGDGSSEAATLTVSPIELIVAESRAQEAAKASSVEPCAEPTAPAPEPAPAVDKAPAQESMAVEAPADGDTAEAVPITAPEPTPSATPLGQTVTVVVQDTIQTFTETLPLVDTSPETSETTRTAESAAEATALPALGKGDPGTTEAKGEAGDSIAIVEAAEAAEARPSEASDIEAGITKPVAAVGPAPEAEVAEAVAGADSQEPAETADSPTAAAAQDPSLLDLPEHIAYEEFLKDTHEPVDLFDAPVDEEPEAAGTQEPVAKIDPSGELQIEMDTKNAHVWNELGNVYYNTTAYDDAIVAYSKAIELDRWFAWPYSNLALAYVQKRRFVEAILLYQRSIELFSSDKDKAVSWNRLGNVYRRLNDYENAIAAYQRADALDPDNATLSLQSRFSLLGNYAMDQKPTYVS